MRLAVLLVGRRAPELSDALSGDARLDLLAADSDAVARAYLSGTAVDRVVCLGESDADGVARSLGIEATKLAADASPADVLAAVGLSSSAPESSPTASVEPDRGEAASRIEALRAEIDRVAHDINNPVAVILGNAQLARELGGAGLDPTIAESLADIETAAEQLVARVRELGGLRTLADGALDALARK